jgi:hypothetical protein
MPQIIITTEGPGNDDIREVHRERIVPADVETETAGHLLVERIGWALSDAEGLEHSKQGPAKAV